MTVMASCLIPMHIIYGVVFERFIGLWFIGVLVHRGRAVYSGILVWGCHPGQAGRLLVPRRAVRAGNERSAPKEVLLARRPVSGVRYLCLCLLQGLLPRVCGDRRSAAGLRFEWKSRLRALQGPQRALGSNNREGVCKVTRMLQVPHR